MRTSSLAYAVTVASAVLAISEYVLEVAVSYPRPPPGAREGSHDPPSLVSQQAAADALGSVWLSRCGTNVVERLG